MLMEAPSQPDTVQIRKLIVSPELWDGNLWSDINDSNQAEVHSLFSRARLIIKIVQSDGPQGGALWYTV